MAPTSTDSVAQDHIRAFVERILRLKEEVAAINGDIREIYAEAKGNGFDKTVLGKLVNYVEKRAKSADTLAEQDALFDLYLEAYDGRSSRTHAHVRESITSDARNSGGLGAKSPLAGTTPEHDADGVIIEYETTHGGERETAADPDPYVTTRRRRHDEEGNTAHDVEVRTRPANAVEEPGRSLASTNTPTESVEAISEPIHEPQAALPAQAVPVGVITSPAGRDAAESPAIHSATPSPRVPADGESAAPPDALATPNRQETVDGRGAHAVPAEGAPTNGSQHAASDDSLDRDVGEASLAGVEGDEDRHLIQAETPNQSTAAGMDRRDNSTEGGGPAQPLDPAAATTLPARTQAEPVDTNPVLRPMGSRLSGCKRPDACAGTWRERCYSCERQWASDRGEDVGALQ